MSSSFQIIKFDSIYKSYGPKLVLAGLTLTISRGQRIALVGENGSGKTTLAKIAAGIESPDLGTALVAKDASVGYLPQGNTSCDAGANLQSLLLAAQGQLDTLAERLRVLEESMAHPKSPDSLAQDMQEWDLLYRYFEERGGFHAQERAQKCLTALGLDHIPLDRPLHHLSGGQKRRALLASLLLQQHDLLILDEPTNHLDRQALIWLEEFLQEYPGAVLLISHDRDFLNRVANGILELSSQQLHYYPGNYDDYLAAKQKNLADRLKTYEGQKEEKAHLQKFLKEQTFSSKGPTAAKDANKMAYDRRGERHVHGKHRAVTQAKARLEDLDKLENPLPKGYTGLVFHPRPLEKIALRLDDLKLERMRRPSLSGILRAGDRIILAGPNGCGKSTLLRYLASIEGRKHFAPSAVIGYLDQETDLEDQHLTPIEYLQVRFALPEHEIRSRLHRLGLIDENNLHKQIENLSLGQKRRIQLLEITLSGANVLLLDEPTNHLAPHLIDELETALISFPGAVMAATHDRRFAQKVGTIVWEI